MQTRLSLIVLLIENSRSCVASGLKITGYGFARGDLLGVRQKNGAFRQNRLSLILLEV